MSCLHRVHHSNHSIISSFGYFVLPSLHLDSAPIYFSPISMHSYPAASFHKKILLFVFDSDNLSLIQCQMTKCAAASTDYCNNIVLHSVIFFTDNTACLRVEPN